MKRLLIASLFASALVSAQAQTHTDSARVLSAEPQYENVNVPRNECTSQWITEETGRGNKHQERQQHQYGGSIMGGLLGGVIGHQFGGGTGKDAATALGVILGAITADQLENNGQSSQTESVYYGTTQREVKRCHTVYDSQTRITGYRVAYEYRGQSYTTFMRTNPGHSLQVRVTVHPVEL